MIRVRHTLLPLTAAITLIGCTSGSEAVPIPGANEISTAPVVTIERPAVDTTPATDTSPGTSPGTATGNSDDVDSSDTTTVATNAPATTRAPPPADPPPATDAPPASNATSDVVYLRLGDEGSEVGLMQFKLSVLGYLPTGSDSGVFDQATESALRRFQSDYGLGVDGVFGPLTDRSLNAAVQSVDVEG